MFTRKCMDMGTTGNKCGKLHRFKDKKILLLYEPNAEYPKSINCALDYPRVWHTLLM